MRLRKFEEVFFKVLMIASMSVVMLSLLTIILVVVIKGGSSLSLSMIIETPKGGYYLGKGGGIANAIVGSFYLSFGALIVSAILSVPAAFALQKEYTGSFFSGFTKLMLDVLWGTPSIVYGAFGFVVMVYFGLRASLLGGIIVLSLLMLPIMTRAMDQVIRKIPLELKEISCGLGATRAETIIYVLFKQGLPGIVTALLLAFGRGIGDAASILFTAGYTDYIPTSFFDPTASLPLAVFFQIGTPIPEVQQRAYAAAFILLVIVLLVSICSRLISHRLSKNIIK